MRAVIVDYGMGNLRSVARKVQRLRHEALVTSDPCDLARADRIILPGVGHFGRAMEQLEAGGWLAALNDAVNERKTPVLGICLGMQLFARSSEEGDAEGLGWLDARVVRLRMPEGLPLNKVPHIGWNRALAARDSPLLRGLPADPEVYFSHSYHLECRAEQDVLQTTDYGVSFVAAVHRHHLFGVQYHPEKSHEDGEALLANFLSPSLSL